MGKLLAYLGGNGPRFLFIGVFLGLLLPELAALFRPLLAPAVASLLLLALLRIDWQQMAMYARRPLLASGFLIWLLLLSPIATWAVLQLLPVPPALNTALVLMAAAPPILGASAIALLVGLDAALAVVIGLACTLLAPLTIPPLALALLGLDLEIGLLEFMGRLGAVVVGAFIGAWLLRQLLGLERLRQRAREIDGLVVLVMLIFAIAIMDGVTATLFERPGTVALWIGAAFIANPVLQVIGTVAFLRLGLRRALTAGLMTGNCNMGLLLAALPPGADFDVVLFFALAQLPMYMLPAVLLPLYRRLMPVPPGIQR